MTRGSYQGMTMRVVLATMAIVLLATPAFAHKPKTTASTADSTKASLPMTRTWNFDHDKTNRLATGWTAVEGNWEVLPDATAPSPPNTFGLPPGRLMASLTHLLNYHSIAVVSGPDEYSDLTVKVDFEPIKGRLDCSGGIVLRYVNPKNYYALTVGCPSDYFRLVRVLKGTPHLLGEQVVPADTHKWYKLEVRAQGSEFTCYDNNKVTLDVSDSKITKGRVGLWAANDSEARFDNFTITVPRTSKTHAASATTISSSASATTR